MSKKIYITEAQLQEIVTNGVYNNDDDTTNEYKLGGDQITVDGTIGDYVSGNVKSGKPVTADKFAQTQSNQRRRRGMINCSKSLTEANQQMKGKENTFQISKSEKDNLTKRVMSYSGSKNDPGYKRAKRLAEKGRVSYDNAYRILDDMQNGRDGAMLDPDGTLKHELETKVGTRADISRSQRNSNIDTESKYKAQGVTYTPNGHNVIGIIYNNGNK